MDLSRQLPSSSMSIANDICNDIIIEILSWLHVDSLLRFKSVSKSWFSLITNPKFVKLHIDHQHSLLTTGATQIHNPANIMFISSDKHYYIKSIDKVIVSSSSSIIEKLELVNPFDFLQCCRSVKIVGSCNGLICLHGIHNEKKQHSDDDILCLWNPSTKEFRILPSHGTDRRSILTINRYGFGYDHIIDDYKVIASAQMFRSGNELSNDDDDKEEEEDGFYDFYESEVQVYTLGTNSWRGIQGKQPYKLVRTYDGNCWGYRNLTTWTHVNGVFHRITQLSSSKLRILSLDIVHEVYREVPNPECFDSRYIWDLTVLKGCLCLSARAHEFVDKYMEVWMMADYGVKESWTKLFHITNNVLDTKRLKPVWLHKNGELVMVGSLDKHGEVVMVGSSELVIYDRKKDDEVKLLKLWSSNVRKYYLPFETNIYIGSLVSLKSHE